MQINLLKKKSVSVIDVIPEILQFNITLRFKPIDGGHKNLNLNRGKPLRLYIKNLTI